MDYGSVFSVDGNGWALLSFSIYSLIIIGIGFFSSKFSSQGLTEFFLGGRKMHKFTVALSAVVSGRSSWLLIGVTGMSYTMGISAVWAVLGYTLTELWMFIFAAPRLRRATEEQKDLTISDYFESRFQDNAHILRFFSVSIILIFMTAYIGAQFVGGGKSFSGSFGISPTSGMMLTAGLVLFYTLLGGFRAVSLTDVVQAFFMVVGLVILPITVIRNMGGPVVFWDTLTQINASFFNVFALGTGSLIGFLGIGLGSPGNPHILVRYMSIRNVSELRFSAFIGTFWNLIMGISAVLIGCVGRAYYPDPSIFPGGDPENVYPLLAHEHLHPVLFGIVVASILAAIMSTADSMLLVCASAVLEDVYRKWLRPTSCLSDKQLVLYSRIVIVFLVFIAILIAQFAGKLVFWLVLFAWGGLGASLGPPMLLSLFWRKTTRWGVLAGFITGTLTTILWYQHQALKSRIYELVPAFFLSLIFTISISLLTQRDVQE